MYTISSYSYHNKTEVAPSHIMMFVVDLGCYIHVWNIEGVPVIKKNIPGTAYQSRVTDLKTREKILEVANLYKNREV